MPPGCCQAGGDFGSVVTGGCDEVMGGWDEALGVCDVPGGELWAWALTIVVPTANAANNANICNLVFINFRAPFIHYSTERQNFP